MKAAVYFHLANWHLTCLSSTAVTAVPNRHIRIIKCPCGTHLSADILIACILSGKGHESTSPSVGLEWRPTEERFIQEYVKNRSGKTIELQQLKVADNKTRVNKVSDDLPFHTHRRGGRRGLSRRASQRQLPFIDKLTVLALPHVLPRTTWCHHVRLFNSRCYM